LTPPSFHTHIQSFYEEIGSPVVTSDTFWTIYHQLRTKFNNQQPNQDLTTQWAEGYEEGFEERVGLMEGQQELRLGAQPQAGPSHVGGAVEDSELADDLFALNVPRAAIIADLSSTSGESDNNEGLVL
jgi:hypothetical protein